jgi:hypothetical protein
MRREGAERHWLRQRAGPAQLIVAEAARRRDPELQTQLGVVAELRMVVERQVVGQQIDIGAQQALQAGVFCPMIQASSFFQK